MKILRPYQAKAVAECWAELRASNKPVLLMASVGAGKSLMLASILRDVQAAGKRVLCLVNNAELVRNNAQTLIDEGGSASIYCAALGEKDCSAPVVFGTPQSVLNGITNKADISKIKFNLIAIDECHAINYNNHRSAFMRVLRHYKQTYEELRVLGATGTDFRYKGEAIVGEECLFKTQVGNITTEKLIDDGYLIKPDFQVDKKLVIDFSKVKIKSTGQFDQKQLAQVIEKSARLTELICKQVIHIMETECRRGVFLFATTKKHAHEILSHLPAHESAIILGETTQTERTRILDDARNGKIKYLVNIAIISVGVDIPTFDTIAYLRPTESLVLLVQTMGRALRLSPATNKSSALVLDFAGNIERHQDWDNPLILDAVDQTINEDVPRVIICPACSQLNTETARRCVGVTNNKRCDYYFEFKECPNKSCNAQNDIASRYCRLCEAEIIDPNAKLNINLTKTVVKIVTVKEMQMGVSGGAYSFRVNIEYKCIDEHGKRFSVYEGYTPMSDKGKNIFYGKFVRVHCEKSSHYYPHLRNIIKVKEMLDNVTAPRVLHLNMKDDGVKIKKKLF
tara:strand:- start:14631 stop:16334 length:1704 start_codon:yes stop_codon:yes gene_type:complete